MALKTATEYKTFTGSGVADAVVTSALSMAQKRIERYIGSDGLDYAADQTEYYDGSGGQAIQLRRWPITVITSVSYRTGDTSNSWVAYDTDTYWYNTKTDNGGLVKRVPRTSPGQLVSIDDFGVVQNVARGQGLIFPRGNLNIRVVYSAGYESSGVDIDTAAPDLIEALYAVTTSILDGRDRSPRLQSENLGSYGYTLRSSEDESKRIRELLRPHRRGDMC